MLALKTLVNVGMEKIVPTKQSRRYSTGNLALEYTDISSRYLKDPVSSCHDNCKQLDNTTTERSNKTPSTFKKLLTLIPKHPTKDAKLTNTSLKPLPNEPIKRNILKSKPKVDPFYIPPSKTYRRRYSEIILPIGGLEDVLDPDPPPVPGFTRSSKKIDSKIELRKDPTKNANIPKKVPTLKTHTSLPILGVDHGPKKSKPTKPVGETVQEKTDSPTSNEREIETGNNEASTSKNDETLKTQDESRISSTSKKNETLKSHDQSNGVVGGKKPESSRRVGKSNGGDSLPQKMKFKQGKMVDTMSSGCSSSRKLNFQRQEKSDEKRQNGDDKRGILRRTCSESDGVLQKQESIKSVNVVLNKAQEVEKKHTRHSSNNLIEEAASKLIQARKSRVQALVGAFEIVSEAKL